MPPVAGAARFRAAFGKSFHLGTNAPVSLVAMYPFGGAASFMPTTTYGSGDSAGQGDPEFVNVVPAGQWLSAYTFYADPTYEETSLVIIRGKHLGRFEDVWLECAGNLTEWKPVGTRGDYEYVRVDLAHELERRSLSLSKICERRSASGLLEVVSLANVVVAACPLRCRPRLFARAVWGRRASRHRGVAPPSEL